MKEKKKKNILLALRVKIDTIHLALFLIKANIIKALEARTVDGAHPVVRHQEVFFPAHEDVLALGRVAHHGVDPNVIRRRCCCRRRWYGTGAGAGAGTGARFVGGEGGPHRRPVLPERRELAPMVHIDFVVGAPARVLGQKPIFTADDLTLEVCC